MSARSYFVCYHAASRDRMEWLKHILHQLTDAETLVRLGGLTAMTAIIFAETGLLIGFFLPGDSLLVTAGVFAAAGQLNLLHLNLLLIAAAIVGDTVGYWFGRKTGPALFRRPRSLLFNPEHLKRAHDFYEKHGGKTIVLARFMPIIRTFAPIVAGMGKMEYRRFLSFNVFGGALWVLSMTLIGYFLGQIPGVREHIEVVILVVVFLSILPGIIAALKEWRKGKRAAIPPAPPV
jgi:membrane-associated protein